MCPCTVYWKCKGARRLLELPVLLKLFWDPEHTSLPRQPKGWTGVLGKFQPLWLLSGVHGKTSVSLGEMWCGLHWRGSRFSFAWTSLSCLAIFHPGPWSYGYFRCGCSQQLVHIKHVRSWQKSHWWESGSVGVWWGEDWRPWASSDSVKGRSQWDEWQPPMEWLLGSSEIVFLVLGDQLLS
jgi:hypothetical protein